MKPIVAKYDPPIIIFINYKQTADWLAEKFQKETNMKVTILHGSKSQEQREHSLQLFRTNKVQIMIATNVAARGLDIPNVSLVVNFQISKKWMTTSIELVEQVVQQMRALLSPLLVLLKMNH